MFLSRKPKIELTLAILILIIVFFSSVIIFTPISLEQIALAFTNTYTKNTGDQLTAQEWENLPLDFLDKTAADTKVGDLTMNGGNLNMTGGSINMSGGSVDMGGSWITNINTAIPSNDGDVATKKYVDDTIVGAATPGGHVYYNWGRNDCPGTAQRLYGGWAFGPYWDKAGGATNLSCLYNDSADPGTGAPSFSSELVPVKLASGLYIPSALSAVERRRVNCAACYNPDSMCYTAWGTDNCAAGFDTANSYTGYAMGGFTLTGRAMETDMYCVNANFSNTTSDVLDFVDQAVLYGAEIESTKDLPANNYSAGTFIRCAVCCN